jgi:hypothetical protein
MEHQTSIRGRPKKVPRIEVVPHSLAAREIGMGSARICFGKDL